MHSQSNNKKNILKMRLRIFQKTMARQSSVSSINIVQKLRKLHKDAKLTIIS